jgi:hypothetical protein
MTRKKNIALKRDREEKARVEVRRILETGPLSLDDAIASERESRRQLKELLENPEDAEDADYIEEAFVEQSLNSARYSDAYDQTLRELAADRLECAVPPSPWRDYALSVLRRPATPSQKVLRRRGITSRNETISWAVRKAEHLGLAVTRNRTQRDKGGALIQPVRLSLKSL